MPSKTSVWENYSGNLAVGYRVRLGTSHPCSGSHVSPQGHSVGGGGSGEQTAVASLRTVSHDRAVLLMSGDGPSSHEDRRRAEVF